MISRGPGSTLIVVGLTSRTLEFGLTLLPFFFLFLFFTPCWACPASACVSHSLRLCMLCVTQTPTLLIQDTAMHK